MAPRWLPHGAYRGRKRDHDTSCHPLATFAMLAFLPTQAHVPDECDDLFHDAGRENEDLVERMNAAFDEIMETTEYRFERLADLFSQALAIALQCIPEEKWRLVRGPQTFDSGAHRPKRRANGSSSSLSRNL